MEIYLVSEVIVQDERDDEETVLEAFSSLESAVKAKEGFEWADSIEEEILEYRSFLYSKGMDKPEVSKKLKERFGWVPDDHFITERDYVVTIMTVRD